MKLEEGMYVRTKDGEIHKCVIIHKDNINSTLDRFMNEWGNMIMFDEILKASDNITDLIERFDLVNGHLVICKMYEDEKDIPTIIKCVGGYYFKEQDIKTIVTKEQFESMSYKVD